MPQSRATSRNDNLALICLAMLIVLSGHGLQLLSQASRLLPRRGFAQPSQYLQIRIPARRRVPILVLASIWLLRLFGLLY
jgi:hypothetical protein